MAFCFFIIISIMIYLSAVNLNLTFSVMSFFNFHQKNINLGFRSSASFWICYYVQCILYNIHSTWVFDTWNVSGCSKNSCIYLLYQEIHIHKGINKNCYLVRNGTWAHSRNSWILTHYFLMNKLINEWMNYSRSSWTAYPPLKTKYHK